MEPLGTGTDKQIRNRYWTHRNANDTHLVESLADLECPRRGGQQDRATAHAIHLAKKHTKTIHDTYVILLLLCYASHTGQRDFVPIHTKTETSRGKTVAIPFTRR